MQIPWLQGCDWVAKAAPLSSQSDKFALSPARAGGGEAAAPRPWGGRRRHGRGSAPRSGGGVPAGLGIGTVPAGRRQSSGVNTRSMAPLRGSGSGFPRGHGRGGEALSRHLPPGGWFGAGKAGRGGQRPPLGPLGAVGFVGFVGSVGGRGLLSEAPLLPPETLPAAGKPRPDRLQERERAAPTRGAVRRWAFCPPPPFFFCKCSCRDFLFIKLYLVQRGVAQGREWWAPSFERKHLQSLLKVFWFQIP